MATDYYPSEEYVICQEPIISFCETGDTSCVAGYGVKSAGTDVSNKIMVILASKNTGWGIALKTVATANQPINVLTRGVVKLLVGVDGSTRNTPQTFGTAGLLGNRSANTVNTCPISTIALQSGTSGDEILYLFGP